MTDKPMTLCDLGYLKDRIDGLLMSDQRSLDELLIEETHNERMISYYEGACSTLRTVLLILEHEC